jgi:hypothetical protein
LHIAQEAQQCPRIDLSTLTAIDASIQLSEFAGLAFVLIRDSLCENLGM